MSHGTPVPLQQQQQQRQQQPFGIPSFDPNAYLINPSITEPWTPFPLEPTTQEKKSSSKKSKHHHSKRHKKHHRRKLDKKQRLGACILQLIGLICLVLAAVKAFEPLTGVGFTLVIVGYKGGMGDGEGGVGDLLGVEKRGSKKSRKKKDRAGGDDLEEKRLVKRDAEND